MKEKTMKKLSQAIVLAGAMTAGLTAVQTAQAEISASVDIASMYLWRGQDLGQDKGTAVVSGALDYSHESGLYAGVWTSSGDSSLGNETDFYAGFAGAVGDFGYDLGYATYIYSETAADEFDDAAEFYLGLSYSMVGITFYVPSDSDADGLYTVLGVDIPDTSFSVALGNYSDIDDEYTHLDVSYAYNDSVGFTVSKIVDEANEDSYDKSMRYVVSYSLPIEM
jgi:uncharacterized protein (TIGR02001 family)